MSDKFKDVDQELELLIPKLVCALQETFADTDFVKKLMFFNSQKSECKVQYGVSDLFAQVTAFADRVIQNKKNGYKGYDVKIYQVDKDAEYKSGKHWIRLECKHTCLDWKSIREGESADTYKTYVNNLGLFLCLTN